MILLHAQIKGQQVMHCGSMNGLPRIWVVQEPPNPVTRSIRALYDDDDFTHYKKSSCCLSFILEKLLKLIIFYPSRASCDYAVKSKEQLRKHEAPYHPQQEIKPAIPIKVKKKFRCPRPGCDKSFEKNAHLSLHNAHDADEASSASRVLSRSEEREQACRHGTIPTERETANSIYKKSI